ncbi:unnamed protein product [Psylliodes chrysocephalus]|uniref:DUF4371 domain-containing protein n=1 Tax=Psylliodes chrysocephalus TaxID=3402493 RepID=A0A9P0G6W9_9CUCU|nr:unnamed protein product [Psylliodes chrysocephala]
MKQFNNHENNEYHKRCILNAEYWLKTYRGTIPSVQMLQNTALQQQIIKNNNAVLPIIETVLFCGRQGIPLRANRDLLPKAQNEIIYAINDIMLKKLVKMVNSAKCFTVLADETTDVSIGVGYLHNNGIRKDFLQFVPVSDLTGKNLVIIILNSLHEFGIDTKFFRGQGYDGTSAISGKCMATQTYVTKEHPTAQRCNIETDTPESYFRISTFLLFLDHV